ncbi:MAG: dTMP kinase [Clostridia bacterium]|nr:dTMP kinase [Clostridia bacterium]
MRGEDMFIAIDGPDGTGKTMLSKLLVERLNEKNLNAIYTFEPTHSPLGLKIREIIKTNGNPKVVLDLFLKDREEHLETFIRPAINEGKIIVCDRYKLSTVCYQENPEQSMEKLIELNDKFVNPDIYFVMYFDEKDVDLVFERIESRGTNPDVYDTKVWINKVNRNFKEMSSHYKNLTFINTNQTVEEILSQMISTIETYFQNVKKRMYEV